MIKVLKYCLICGKEEHALRKGKKCWLGKIYKGRHKYKDDERNGT